MTCIAAVAQGGKVWMAGDSAAITEYDVMHLAEPKVFRIGPFVMGVSGDAGVRLIQILRYLLEVPEREQVDEVPAALLGDTRWLVREFVPALSATLSAAGFLKRDAEVQSIARDASVLIGYRGRLYQLDASLQVVPLSESYAALGSGAEVALGSLHTSEWAAGEFRDGSPFLPEVRVKAAVRAAAEHARGVREPITVEVI